MKTTILALTTLALPAALAVPIDYTPEGGWESIDWTKIDYPEGTGENLPYYPPPPGGWENVDYPAGTGAGEHVPPVPLPTPQEPPTYPPQDCDAAGPFTFTSTYHVHATPEQVVNGTTPTGGLAGASGEYAFGLNSDLNVICYNITLRGFRGDFQSPALTATHIHEAARGQSGPPRIAFPNPVLAEGEAEDDANAVRRSVGCLMGPFETGLDGADGVDNGARFEVRQIEEAPENFFADVHSSLAVPGAVRGQIA